MGHRTLFRRAPILRGTALGALSLALLVGGASCEKFGASGPKPQGMVDTPPDYSVWAVDLLRECEADPAAADRKYAGKVIEVVGTLWSVDFHERPGGGNKASRLVVGSWGSQTKIDCPLDPAMDDRCLILDYFSQVKLKGRYAGREGPDQLRLQDCVVVQMNVSVKDVEPRATVPAAELMRAYWPEETARAEAYQGRVIVVEGTVRDADPEHPGDGDGTIILKTGDADLAIRCQLDPWSGKPPAGRDRPRPVRFKGLCAGRVAGFAGVTLVGCVLAN